MALIDGTFFYGELEIAQQESPGIAESLGYAMVKYEKQFLYRLLGKTLADTFISHESDGSGIWYDLKLQLVDSSAKDSPIARYVYYFYQRDDTTRTVGAGQAKPAAQNAVMVSSFGKMVKAWNDMARQVRDIIKFLKANPTSYPVPTDCHYRRDICYLGSYQNQFQL